MCIISILHFRTVQKSGSEDMAKRKADENREQLSVGVEEELKRRLEEAARMSARSLSGEALFRLRRSFQQEPEAA